MSTKWHPINPKSSVIILINATNHCKLLIKWCKIPNVKLETYNEKGFQVSKQSKKRQLQIFKKKERKAASKNKRSQTLRNKGQKVTKRLEHNNDVERPNPMITASNIHYEMSEKTNAISSGGGGARFCRKIV